MEENTQEKYQEEYEIKGITTIRSKFLSERGEEICDELKCELQSREEDDYSICDVISDLSSSYIEIMNGDLIDSISDLYWDGFYEYTISEIGSQGDLIKDIQMCQGDAYSYCLNTNLDTVVKNMVYDKLYELGVDVDKVYEYAPIAEAIDERVVDIDGNLSIKELHEKINEVANDVCKQLDLEVNKELTR